MTTRLVLHTGTRPVELKDLELVPTPPATDTWFPVGHADVAHHVREELRRTGYVIRREQYGLSRNDLRMFGTLDLESSLAPGVALAVGVRNSNDKSLPIGFCAGSRVFVCDNLAFTSEVTIARKHTRFGKSRYLEALALAVQGLSSYAANEAARIGRLQQRRIDDTTAESMLLRAFEDGILSSRVLPEAIKLWREPPFEEFATPTAWSLFNAFTGVLSPRRQASPQEHAKLTIRLHELFAPLAA